MKKNRKNLNKYLKLVDMVIERTSSHLRETHNFIARSKEYLKKDDFVYVKVSCKKIIDFIRPTDEAMLEAMHDLAIAKETMDLFKIEPLVDLIKTYTASFSYDPTKDLKEILAR